MSHRSFRLRYYCSCLSGAVSRVKSRMTLCMCHAPAACCGIMRAPLACTSTLHTHCKLILNTLCKSKHQHSTSVQPTKPQQYDGLPRVSQPGKKAFRTPAKARTNSTANLSTGNWGQTKRNSQSIPFRLSLPRAAPTKRPRTGTPFPNSWSHAYASSEKKNWWET